MAVPKQKKSRRRTRQGRSHHSLSAPTLAICKKCGEKVRPHTACSFCGYYGDKKVIDIETKLDKKVKKKENSNKDNNQ